MNTQVEQIVIKEAMDAANWVKKSEVPQLHPQFKNRTLTTICCKRYEDPTIQKFVRVVGKYTYINVKIMGLWLAGELA
ncbi:hypothetical protein AB4098_09420 [Vibrio cyclitrophicus]